VIKPRLMGDRAEHSLRPDGARLNYGGHLIAAPPAGASRDNPGRFDLGTDRMLSHQQYL
jgi:hypothetical protein